MNPICYIVETGSADGMIINQTRPDDPRVRFLTERDFPFATNGRTAMGIDHPYVDCNTAAFVETVLGEFVAHGRRRLLLIPPPYLFTYGRLMTESFLGPCSQIGVTGEVAVGFDGHDADDDIERCMAFRMGQPDPPDAVVAGTANAAISAVAGLETAGFQLGQDVDVAGREPIRLLRRLRPQIMALLGDAAKTGTYWPKQ